MDGVYPTFPSIPPRHIEVMLTIKGSNRSVLRRKVDRLNEILSDSTPSEIVFNDEPEVSYFGMLLEVNSELETETILQTSVTFICPDPYKYGKEESDVVDSDTFIVENKGTANAEPIFELTAKEKTTRSEE